MNKIENSHKLLKIIKQIERDNFTGKKLIELNCNQGKVGQIYEVVRKEVKN
ncbi:MAG: hypothetical protein HQ552_10935 [Desulfobacteraceae bacterium]|nr:hypothetical protein [Desulfobacteraceae bacterium]